MSLVARGQVLGPGLEKAGWLDRDAPVLEQDLLSHPQSQQPLTQREAQGPCMDCLGW